MDADYKFATITIKGIDPAVKKSFESFCGIYRKKVTDVLKQFIEMQAYFWNTCSEDQKVLSRMQAVYSDLTGAVDCVMSKQQYPIKIVELNQALLDLVDEHITKINNPWYHIQMENSKLDVYARNMIRYHIVSQHPLYFFNIINDWRNSNEQIGDFKESK